MPGISFFGWMGGGSGGGGGAGNYTVQDVAPTTGQTVTSNGSQVLALAPSGTLATLTVVFPASAANGQPFLLNTTQTITSLTFSTSDGSTIQLYSTPSQYNPGGTFFVFDKSQSQWLLI